LISIRNGNCRSLLQFVECPNILTIIESLSPVTAITIQIDVALEVHCKESAEVTKVKQALKKAALNTLKMCMYLPVYLCMYKPSHY